MDKKIDRLKRQQQRLWRKAAVSILAMHQNIAILLAFLMIIMLGLFWGLIDHRLESHLLKNARSYGYSMTNYIASDVKQLILSDDIGSQQKYLQRLISDPLIIEARLYDHQGALLANSVNELDVVGEEPSEESLSANDPAYLTLLEDIFTEKQRIGIIQLKINRQHLEQPIHKILNDLSILTVVLMILAIIIAWIVSKRLTRSLRKLLKFPVNSPQDSAIKNLDVSSELKLMLESSSISGSPAPVSRAEESGLHQLLAADSVAEISEVITLKLYLGDLADWLKPDSGTPNVQKLRQLDRLLILTIHSQQGHLLSFDGITAQACFGLDGNLSSATYRAASCSLLLKTLLEELSLSPKICLRKEERLLIRHMKRTPVAIPIHSVEDENERLFSNHNLWLLLHNNMKNDQRLREQMRLTTHDDHWVTIAETNTAAQSMLDRQLTWIRYLLSKSSN